MKESSLIKIITVLLILATSLIISLRGSFSFEPLWPDGQRYTFDGILIHDMVRDGAICHPFQYSTKFYARYPAIDLPYGPPFLATVFAAGFGLFGISFSVARCIISGYTVCAALMCWYLVYRIRGNYWHSLLAVAAFLLNPLTVNYSRDITPEVPVAFYSFLVIYFFYNYVENDKKYCGLWATLALGLGYLTKPYIIPLGISLPLYVVFRKKWNILYKGETWLCVFLGSMLIVPQTVLAFKFTNEYFLQTGHPINWKVIMGFPAILIRRVPILILFSITGFIVGIVKRDKFVYLSLIYAACWYIFFTFYNRFTDVEKYLVSFIPSIVVPFVLGYSELISKIKGARLKRIVVILTLMIMAYGIFDIPVYFVQGYEAAGEYVAKNPRGKSVLFYGSYDGSFMLGIRRHVSGDGPYVLRGDRQLAVRLFGGELKDDKSVRSGGDIIGLLDRCKTGYVVVEKDMPRAREYQEYKNLMEVLEEKVLFEEVARFPIRTNYAPLGSALIIYKFNLVDKFNIKEEITISIPMPTLNGELKIKF